MVYASIMLVSWCMCLSVVLVSCVYVCCTGFVASMVLVQLHDGKVFSLNWCLPLQESPNDTEFLFSCGPDGKVVGLFKPCELCG